MAMVPLLLPAEVGLKYTVTVLEEPAAMVAEEVPTVYCPDPVPTEMLVTISAAVPGLEIVKVFDEVEPTLTLPKARLEGDISI